MAKTVSASAARNRFGAVLSWVLDNRDEVIIENRGEPAVVIMSYTEYKKVKQLKEEQRRKDALQRLRALREEVRSRNQDITTDEQAMQIADQFGHDLADNLVKNGEVSFEQE
ncbi:MAG TPA: type II toxin-antitoxin system prevent-host-death family antitoxin [Chloroflexia bacterium]|nr:type II toxin-antitoxin system prevent-host-death family antitoxin [Chloroflexia bacterium]